MLSIAIPIYNEGDNIRPVYERLISVLEPLSRPFEIIFVNDGSRDSSEERLRALASQDERIKVIVFKRNFGQAAAMMAAIDHAEGEIIIPMDGDLQNDPADIPRLIEKLEEGYEVVSGWRRDRQDSAITRNLVSRIANALISTVSGVQLHDYGCTLKAYRRETLKPVKLYGEMHRFIPIFVSWQGGKVTEIEVAHHPRVHGESKYGLGRVPKVLLDLAVVQFLGKYETKPIYVFGGFGLLSLFIAFLAGAYAIWRKLVEGTSFISTPLPLLVTMTALIGVMSILMGLLAEVTIRIYFESQGKQAYVIKETLNMDREDHP